ncbi:PHD finger protein ALFIN-LIKE 2 [Striga hermonthica]|uniref:PHD finger protein ALFIN-LIKE n=1 Tax=Striga hermonthica TaxID=68872 RepID=A0A9N7NU86_STRHE|nr:PHD finger protein ALFIN-LIKE 2 [Striga hermonthica]
MTNHGPGCSIDGLFCTRYKHVVQESRTELPDVSVKVSSRLGLLPFQFRFTLRPSIWEVNLPAEEVPPELPEPALGINFARDGMNRRDWLSLIAVHSDCWLLFVAFYLGARLNRNESMMNELPTVFEVVTERKPVKDKPNTDSGSKSRNSTKAFFFTVRRASLCAIDEQQVVQSSSKSSFHPSPSTSSKSSFHPSPSTSSKYEEDNSYESFHKQTGENRNWNEIHENYEQLDAWI